MQGPDLFAGYWRNPEKTAQDHTADGWFSSDDIATQDEAGCVRIVGRSKNLIISGGYNIYPKEVELAIDALDGVLESAVVGLPHPGFGEGVLAVVARAPGADRKPRPSRSPWLRNWPPSSAPSGSSSSTSCPATPWGRCRRRSCASPMRTLLRPCPPERLR